jgi:lipid II:glycine glycyltransferase (peptidoglycan interpeptide bridge formation enzyme)
MGMEYFFKEAPENKDLKRWAEFVLNQKTGTLFQMPFWADVYQPRTHRWIFYWGEEAGQIRICALIRGKKIPYWGFDYVIERGPVCDEEQALLAGIGEILKYLKKEKAISLRVNPYWEFPAGMRIEEGLVSLGFQPFQRKEDIHYQTIAVDLKKDQNELFKNLRKTTRYEIKRAQKLGLTVRSTDNREDLWLFYELLKKTGAKKNFDIPQYPFLLNLWENVLKKQKMGALLMTHYHGDTISGLILLKHGLWGVYSWGASDPDFKVKVSRAHLGLWEGMLWAKSQGCALFDMGGLAGSEYKDAGMGNVDFFKTGFGGELCRLVKIHQYTFQRWKEKLIRPFLH